MFLITKVKWIKVINTLTVDKCSYCASTWYVKKVSVTNRVLSAPEPPDGSKGELSVKKIYPREPRTQETSFNFFVRFNGSTFLLHQLLLWTARKEHTLLHSRSLVWGPPAVSGARLLPCGHRWPHLRPGRLWALWLESTVMARGVGRGCTSVEGAGESEFVPASQSTPAASELGGGTGVPISALTP